MIATHNIKVNGKWVLAGEEYEPADTREQVPVEPVKEVTETEPEAEPEVPKAVPRQRNTTRRNTRK